MKDLAEPATVWKRSPIIRAAPASVPVVPPGIVLITSPPSGSGLALATVGLVLIEALVLYAGYGALTGVVGPAARELLESR